MYKVTVIWEENDQETQTDVFEFKTIGEAIAFRTALRLMEEKDENVDNCLSYFQTYIRNKPKFSSKELIVLSFLTGLWSILWWALFTGSTIADEYVLIGLCSTLVVYIVSLLHRALKYRC
jgi:hypothetical protein